ncbi:Aminotransferase, class III [Croceitalea dokdonensis DOKDO 023]|uniref:Aminotransferase, class III n=1 Tax=Croceitalea dokdonensis DOKDO 023 TaxID=1300341 RepID=A0A0P7AX74_9FLAO|nr:aminotransferase class III-fold pyridoxal phosphate-dependent enzyme [Croceitalea dokdonensis]KPM33379.1 Aminotransferase, class III [Croceitalea dokdonensis DOKDO 023]
MELKTILTKEFGFNNPQMQPLEGYDNKNYKVTDGAKKYVFKTYPFSESVYDTLLSENEVLLALEPIKTLSIPKPIPFKDGTYVKKITIEHEIFICRLLTFIEGTFLGDTTYGKETARKLGGAMAALNTTIAPLKSYALQARAWPWDLQHFELNQAYLRYVPNVHDRSKLSYFFQRFKRHVRPNIPKLRKQIIHNDANEWNVLAKDGEVSGLIDFGDLTHAPLINEVAIAMTYMAYDKKEPLPWAIEVLKGYHDISPILEHEAALLYDLIAARLCTSICNSAFAKHQQPKNTYTYVSEKYAWDMLNHWLTLNPIKVTAGFKAAIGIPSMELADVTSDLQRRNRHISPILSVSYQRPIAMHAAAFQYMYDKVGNTFLDAYNNIPHVGHCHPLVVEAAQKQMETLNTNTRYLYDQLAEYAEKLLEKCPKPLNKVFFVNSGSAASDLAVRMAKAHTQKDKMVVLEHGYHGNTEQSIAVSDYKFNHPKGNGQPSNVIKVPLPDTYRGDFQDKKAGKKYALALQEALRNQSNIAAFIAESIVGCGGQVPLAEGYLKEVYPIIRSKGGLCIADEVQTGFGRLGTHFWGFQTHGVVPDILILGKPMGNGHPIGAVVCTDAVAESFEKGVEFFSSFGGNPVSCAVGLAVLEVIAKEGLQENAQAVGTYYLEQLRHLQQKHPVIGDVRGSGLFLGIDIVHPNTKNTYNHLAQYIKNEFRKRHILISTDGPDDSVIKTKPPLCFTKGNVDHVITSLDNLLKTFMANATL